MQQILLIIQFIQFILDVVPKFVELAEKALPPGTPGAARLELVKGWIAQAVATEAQLAPVFEAAWPYVKPVIDGIVAQLKATKISK